MDETLSENQNKMVKDISCPSNHEEITLCRVLFPAGSPTYTGFRFTIHC